MMPRLIRIGMWLIALASLVGAIATLVLDVPILSQCSKSCWLNSFLFGLFGEVGSRIGVALAWLAVAGFCAYVASGGKKGLAHES
jgi:hypothetical protein